MPLEKTFRSLTVAVRRFLERVDEVQLTFGDKPPKHDAVVVDHFEYAISDLQGWLAEALLSAREAEKLAGDPANLDRLRRALAVCQERFQRIDQVFSANLLSYERLEDLTRFGSEHRGEWPSWVTSLKQGIEHCRQALQPARNTLAECWQEIAERSGGTSISVRTSNIGQKIVTQNQDESSVLTREGLT